MKKRGQRKETSSIQFAFLNRKGQIRKQKFSNLHLKKLAQMKISFGMIFSLLIIIFIVAFAFFGIKKFIGIQEAAMIGQFKDNLQNDINDLYLGPQGNPSIEYSLPKKIEGVCFEDRANDNLYFLPLREYSGKGTDINHIDWEKTSEENNGNTQLCIENIDGTITIKLQKDFGDNLVTILR